jgi:hypothetical protein
VWLQSLFELLVLAGE